MAPWAAGVSNTSNTSSGRRSCSGDIMIICIFVFSDGNPSRLRQSKRPYEVSKQLVPIFIVDVQSDYELSIVYLRCFLGLAWIALGLSTHLHRR